MRELRGNRALCEALSQEMADDERVFLLGEDLARHGGVFRVTEGLIEQFGPRRVIAILFGFCGTLLILKPGTDSFQWVSLMPVAAGLCYAATILSTRRVRPAEPR